MLMKFSELVSEETGGDLDARHGFPISRMIEALQRINTATPSNANAASAFNMANHTGAIASAALHDILEFVNTHTYSVRTVFQNDGEDMHDFIRKFSPMDSDIPQSNVDLLNLVLDLIQEQGSKLKEYDSIRVETTLGTIIAPSAIISNILIWKGMLRSGTYAEHVISQVGDYVTALGALPQTDDFKVQRERALCVEIAQIFVRSLEQTATAQAGAKFLDEHFAAQKDTILKD